jgi:hypothetical protein
MAGMFQSDGPLPVIILVFVAFGLLLFNIGYETAKRWKRFNLLSLMLLMTAVAIVCGLAAYFLRN